jgi:hypothetical protein
VWSSRDSCLTVSATGTPTYEASARLGVTDSSSSSTFLGIRAGPCSFTRRTPYATRAAWLPPCARLRAFRAGPGLCLYVPNVVEKQFGNSEWVPNRGYGSGQEGSKESRSVASWRQRSALETPSALFQTVSEGEFSEVRLYGASFTNGPYASAVSKNVMPRSKAVRMREIICCSSAAGP